MVDAPKSIGHEIEVFAKHIDSIGNVFVGVVVGLQEGTAKAKDALAEFENEKCEVTTEDDKRIVRIEALQYGRWRKLYKRFERYDCARELLPRSALVSLVSQYDAYLGRILRVIFERKPQILNSSDRKISFEDLSHFTSIEQVRESVIEKEIENVLRMSHAEQFRWMEKCFDVPLTKGLECWGAFIEITERRNLFVHADGIVSSQYLAVCRQHGCFPEGEPAEGVSVDVPQKYFLSSYQCIYEIGVKLGHVLWRKLLPEERPAADSALVDTTFELIDSGHFVLARSILEFACNNFKKFSSERDQLTMTVNCAQACKWSGDQESCNRLMRAIDWSAKGDEFKLADAVLSSNWDKAAKIMRRIGTNGPVGQPDYHQWPLFTEWRKRDEFLAVYKEIFGEKFVQTNETPVDRTTRNKRAVSVPKSERAAQKSVPETQN